MREPLLSDYEILNVHPSLLPRWRGAAPIERAIMAGDERTGVSLMRLVAELDAGPGLRGGELEIAPDDDYGSLGDRLARARRAGCSRTRCAGRATYVAQDDGGATYAEKISAADRVLDPARPRSSSSGACARCGRTSARGSRTGSASCARSVADGPALAPGALAVDDGRLVLRRDARDARARARPAARRASDGRRRVPARPCRLSGCAAGHPRAAARRSRPRPSRPSPARAAAYTVLRRTFEQGAFTDRAFHAAARGLGPRDRALAMHLAYGAVQRARTLDHLIEQLAGRPPARSTRRCWRRCGSAASSCASPAAPTTRPSTTPSSWPSRRARPRARQRGAAADRARARRAARGARRRRPRRRPRCATRCRRGSSSAGGRSSAPRRARALLARVNEPAESALRANTLRIDAAALAASLPVARAVPGEPPEAVIALEPFDAHGSPQWRDGLLMPQSRAAMLVAHALAPAARRARARPVRRARRQDDPHRGADGRRAARSSRSSATPAAPAALQRTAQRMGAATSPSRSPTRRGRGASASASRASSSTRRARASARCSRTPTCAGAPRRSGRARSPSSRPGYCPPRPPRARRGGCSSTRRARSRRPRTSARSERSSMHTPSSPRSTCRQRFRRGRTRRAPTTCWRSPHVQGSDGFFIAALRRGGAER